MGPSPHRYYVVEARRPLDSLTINHVQDYGAYPPPVVAASAAARAASAVHAATAELQFWRFVV